MAALASEGKGQMALHVMRHNSILEILDEEAEVRVARLAEQLHVSEMTIRRDLSMLESQGKLRRVFGGAVPAAEAPPETVAKRALQKSEEKRMIARQAANFIKAGMDVFVGGGSTTLFLSEETAPDAAVRYTTNSMEIASRFCENAVRDVHVLGGALRRGAHTLMGPETIEMLERRSFDIAFIGITAIEARHGFLEPTEWHAWLVKTLRNRAAGLLVLADHTKFTTLSDLRVLDFGEVDVLITDRAPPAEHVQAMAGHRIRTVYPGAEAAA